MVYYHVTIDGLKEKKQLIKDLSFEIECISQRIVQNSKDIKSYEFIRMIQMKQVGITVEKIKQLNDKKRDDVSSLRDVNLKKSRMDEEIKNVRLIEAIIVDDESNKLFSNGLVDLKRDVLMKLIGVILDKKKTRVIIGMTRLFYEWSRLKVFHWNQKFAPSMRWTANPTADASIKCTETRIGWGDKNVMATFLVDRLMMEGIHKVEIEVSGKKVMTSIYLGLCSNTIKLSRDLNCCPYYFPETCFFKHNIIFCGGSEVFNGSYCSIIANDRKHLIGLELDMGKGVLFLFVDRAQRPFAVEGVSKSVFFVASGHCKMLSLKLKSFRKLSSSTSNPSLKCKRFAWEGKKT